MRFTVEGIDVKVQVAGPNGPVVETRHVATGPATLALYAPASEGRRFGGDFWVPPGRVLDVAVTLTDVTLVDQGSDETVGFGVGGAQSTGILHFRPPLNSPPIVVHPGEATGYLASVPCGLNGALQPVTSTHWRLDSQLPGAPTVKPVAFPFSTHRLAVRYKSSASPGAIAAFQSTIGATTAWSSPTGLRALEFQNLDWWSIPMKLQVVRANPLVDFAVLDPLMSPTHHVSTAVDDPEYSDNERYPAHWIADVGIAPSDLGGSAAWDMLDTMPNAGREVIVGVLDEGLDIEHPDLVNNLYVNMDELPTSLDSLCGWSTGESTIELLDFDADGVFTLHDLNSPNDTTARDSLLSALATCGYPLTPTGTDDLYTGEDLLTAFGDGTDCFNGESCVDSVGGDGVGVPDDIVGVNWLPFADKAGEIDSRALDPWDPDNDDLLDIFGASFPDDALVTDLDSLPDYQAIPGIQHGTQMAGLIGAEADNGRNIAGVAKRVRVLEARTGYVETGDTTDIASWYGGCFLSMTESLQATEYLIAEGASVVLWEFGIYWPDDEVPSYAGAEMKNLNEELAAWPEVTFVFGGGNNVYNTKIDCDSDAYWCAPGGTTASNALTVAAATVADADGSIVDLAPWTTYGATTFDLAAPGGFESDDPATIVSLTHGAIYSGFAYDPLAAFGSSGTSAASAIVAGSAALLITLCGDPGDGTAVAEALHNAATSPTQLAGRVRDGAYLEMSSFATVCPW